MMHNIDHDALSGTRIGEASNPGPAGAGVLQELLGGLDLKSLLRDLPTNHPRDADGQKCCHTCRRTWTEAAEEAKAEAEKAPSTARWRGGCCCCCCCCCATRSPGPSLQRPGQRQRQGWRQRQRCRPGATPGPLKGGAAADARQQGADGGWVTVARKVKPQEAFTLRAKDWTAPILKAGELAAQLDALPDGKTLQGVVLAPTDDVFVSLKSVLRGCPKPHQVLLLRPSREPGSQRVPGQVGERLAFS